MFENIIKFFKNIGKKEEKNNETENSKDAAKERLHLVLMQDRANVSADFLELMKQEIIEVIKKYIDVDENSIDVRLTNQPNEDGSNGAPALYANIPIISIKEDQKVEENKEEKEKTKKETEEKVENKEQEENSETIEETESSEPKEGKHSLANEEEKEQEDKSEEESKE